MSLNAHIELSALEEELKYFLQRDESRLPSRGCFSRPSRALPSSTVENRVDLVVAPPANISRAAGTMTPADHIRGITNLIETLVSPGVSA